MFARACLLHVVVSSGLFVVIVSSWSLYPHHLAHSHMRSDLPTLRFRQSPGKCKRYSNAKGTTTGAHCPKQAYLSASSGSLEPLAPGLGIRLRDGRAAKDADNGLRR